ncbi:MAG TPA: hypothetical protein VLV49_02800 [Terriglobales bacterium]|nr:hypothetical protein [Terriglobales bacterium]
MTSSRRSLAAFVLLAFFILGSFQSAHAFPAFARKYGLRCSACHEAWPMLNAFGQKFKDNGYQLMDDRDSPIWQNNGYWPVTFRITPYWHRDSTDKVSTDQASTGQQKVTINGFDLSGLDILSGGTIYKNISFLMVPSADETGAFHFESVNVRFDNVAHSSWLNFKMGKFELDNLVSEKREITLSGNGANYLIYHFIPATCAGCADDSNVFGQVGDNQLGVEWLGHSYDDRTRISATLMSTNDGNVDLPTNSYGGFFAASQAFDAGKLGLQRVGFYAMVGQSPTYYLTSGGTPLGFGSLGNKTFTREGFVGLFYLGKLDFQVVTQHGEDDAFLATGTAANTALPTGARNATWNGGLVETHYVYNPQLIFIQRYDWVRMSQQATPGTPSTLGNMDQLTFGYRYYPFMTSRAGLAWHNEYSWLRQRGMAPDGTDLTTGTLMLGLDFDF